ncbi:response regulator [Flavobacterium sp. SUN046]|uniref:LytR/AlgR family response regulator transcription factor n=1 Tax=Flavobacterium sp. SUN046 TaxID=3002440 RepID=UPI002DB645A9|nr:response regulator [Flavobacterium sp. SUN046]MEC4050482.1 response regulator [Flavobacterium sp. SUN046]
MKYIRAIIVEDDKFCLELLMLSLKKYCPLIHVIGDASCRDMAIELINSRKPDLVFFDVNLKDGDSFEVLDSVHYKEFKRIFISSAIQEAFRAVQYNAVDFLLKPLDPLLLVKAINRAFDNSNVEPYFNKVNHGIAS